MSLSVLAIRRARLYSPGHEADDWLVLKETAELLAQEGRRVRFLTEEEIGVVPPQADLVLNMCQGPESNHHLGAAERAGTLVVNRPGAALDCLRFRLLPKLRAAGIPIPESLEFPISGGLPAGSGARHSRWLKRADVHATDPGDVVRVEDEQQARATLAAFRGRGLERAIVQEHLEGAVVKFYAVGDRFFHHLVTSGEASVAIDLALLRQRSRQCAEALGLDIYGGECVVTRDGRLPVIDVNDWPSFAPCRRDAAHAIAQHVLEKAQVAA
jgi:hypothetical protein